MNFVIYLIATALFIVVLFFVYIRFAPSDVARWHQPIDATESTDFKAGAIRVVSAEFDIFERVDGIMKNLPRTTVLAGSVADDRITYVTRTKLIGFPDYTTVEFADGKLKMFARLRFGQSDLGVNRSRLERVLSALK